MPIRMKRRQLSGIVAGLGSSLVLTRAGFAQESIAGKAASRGIIYGATVTRGQVEESPDMRRIVSEEMAMIVPGYEFKWSGHQPGPDRFDFTNADYLMRYAAENGKQVRGHALVWHEALPPWFAGLRLDAAAMRQLLTLHLNTVVNRYAGRIHSWDVVNEPVEPWDKRPDGLRDTPFLRALGPDYIDLAFRLAAAADPRARLVLNEYGVEMATEEHERRRRALLALLENMKRRGVPIHAVGIQAHLQAADVRFDPALFRRFLRDIASLGLDCYITEMDVTDRGLPPDLETRDRRVAQTYRRFLDAALAEPCVKMLILWGISDRYTWMNDSRFARREDGQPVRPHPYDAEFRRKPAWYAIAEAFDAAPPR